MNAVKGKNGTRYSSSIKERAISLRRAGKTHREIKKILGISLGTASLWTKGIVLSQNQKVAIQKRKSAVVFTPELRQKLSAAARVHLKSYHFKQKHTKQTLIQAIQDFYLKNQRIPTKREFGDPKVYRAYFGSWNTAIQSAGFHPNPILFARKHIAKDGHICDSFSEMIIDDWMSSRKIAHCRNVRYGSSRLTADFSIGDGVFLEFFGLAGVQRKYDTYVARKRKLAQKLELALIAIYPRDLFPKNQLSKIIHYGEDATS